MTMFDFNREDFVQMLIENEEELPFDDLILQDMERDEQHEYAHETFKTLYEKGYIDDANYNHIKTILGQHYTDYNARPEAERSAIIKLHSGSMFFLKMFDDAKSSKARKPGESSEGVVKVDIAGVPPHKIRDSVRKQVADQITDQIINEKLSECRGENPYSSPLRKKARFTVPPPSVN